MHLTASLVLCCCPHFCCGCGPWWRAGWEGQVRGTWTTTSRASDRYVGNYMGSRRADLTDRQRPSLCCRKGCRGCGSTGSFRAAGGGGGWDGRGRGRGLCGWRLGRGRRSTCRRGGLGLLRPGLHHHGDHARAASSFNRRSRGICRRRCLASVAAHVRSNLTQQCGDAPEPKGNNGQVRPPTLPGGLSRRSRSPFSEPRTRPNFEAF